MPTIEKMEKKKKKKTNDNNNNNNGKMRDWKQRTEKRREKMAMTMKRASKLNKGKNISLLISLKFGNLICIILSIWRKRGRERGFDFSSSSHLISTHLIVLHQYSIFIIRIQNLIYSNLNFICKMDCSCTVIHEPLLLLLVGTMAAVARFNKCFLSAISAKFRSFFSPFYICKQL